MLRELRDDWRCLRRGTPGRRFQDAYRRRRQGGGRSKAYRVLTLVAGVVLTIAGPIAGLVPGPGGIVLFLLGVALLASEVRPAARLLDWCEPRVRAGARRVKRAWTRSAAVTKVSVCLVGLALASGIGYAVYTWVSS
jgi:uncharacterized protein (TIGR02611 family)